LSIVYLTYQQIDKQKWDACIRGSLNRLIYARSFYLDHMAEHWDALVLNDYEAVMPLIWKKKWGISYLYQPAFLQQGGIFYRNEIADSILQSFVDNAFAHFKFAEITLNYTNKPAARKNASTIQRNNFLLSLVPAYEDIYKSFSGGTIKNIKRAANRDLKYQYQGDYLPILKLYKQLYGDRLPGFVQTDYRNFSRICKLLAGQNNLVVRTVTNNQNEIIAGLIILIDNNRLYNMVSCVTPEGRKEEANYFLYNGLIKEFSKSQYLLDFEGSDIKGIADFYKGFAPYNEPYPFIKMNKLPLLIRIFKH
jgi:Acetyltransferase (GNAT) domain